MNKVDHDYEHSRAAAQLFDAKAETWAEKYSGILKSRLEVFEQSVTRRVASGGKILDFGCGAGVIALRLAQEGYRVSGIDIAPDMIAQAKANAARLQLPTEFHVGDTTVLDRMGESFDAVVSSSVLEYLPNASQALAAIRQCLIPGGHAIVTVPNRMSLVRHCERVARLGAQWSRGLPLPVKAQRYAQYLLLSRNHFTVKGFAGLSERNGLHVVEHMYLRHERPNSGWGRALQSSMLLFVMVRR